MLIYTTLMIEPVQQKKKYLEPALYLVPVPIGNRDDITLRALKTLQQADIIACEDTRTTGQLLALYNITANELIACHDHNEAACASRLTSAIEMGKSVVYVSDAGTPTISDPGFRLVQSVIFHNQRVIPLPGATASITAFIASGMPSNEFVFAGFPPHKKGRKTFIEKICSYPIPVILYESPHRICSLLETLIELDCGAYHCSVARELTKLYEEHIRGSVKEVHAILSSRETIKGEIVVVLWRGILSDHGHDSESDLD